MLYNVCYARYHMYGADVDTLSVYIQNSTSLGQVQWRLNGTQGNQWHYAQIDISIVSPYIVGHRFRSAISTVFFTSLCQLNDFQF